MTRYETTLVERVSAILGDEWTVEAPRGVGRLIATHSNRSRTMVGLYGTDGRRNATDEDAREAAVRLRRFLAGEVPKYTPEWADRAREALASLPTPVA